MANVHRLRSDLMGNPALETEFPVASATVIAIGDLLYWDGADVNPAADITYTSLAATQTSFAACFVGVAMQASASGATTPIRVAQLAIAEYPCASATFEVGDAVAPDDNAAPDALTSQQVIAATGMPIGKVWQREAVAVTSVIVMLQGVMLPIGFATLTTLALADSAAVIFGTGSDVSILWDGTNLIISTIADDKIIEIGDSATTQLSFDLKWYGNAASGASYLYADASDDVIYTVGVDLWLKDADVLAFGTGASKAGDVSMVVDGTTFIVKAATDDWLIEIGDSAATQLSFDLKWYGNAANGADYLYFDASGNIIYTTGVDLQFKDNDFLVFGTGAGDTGDVGIKWDSAGTMLEMLPTTDDTGSFNIGDGTADIDVKIFLGTSGEYVLFDVGNSLANFQVPITAAQTITYSDEVVHSSAFTETKSANYTMDINDCGKIIYVDTNAVVITLPSTAVGLYYTFVNAGATDGTVGFSISPAAIDLIKGCDLAPTDDEDIINTAATAKHGDRVSLVADGVNGWMITEMSGTWAEETP